jgi:hypothetical protein
MPVSLLLSPTPVRDLLVAMAEGVIGDAEASLSGSCAACNRAVTSWCVPHAEDQAVKDDLTPVLWRLYETDTDEEACEIAGDLFFLPGMGEAS